MTREEREEAARIIKEHCYFANLIPQAKEALNMAIKTLEPDPCEDAISRQAAIDAIYKMHMNGKEGVLHDLKTETGSDAFFAETITDAVEALEELPTVHSQPKTGHWIKISPAGIYECSECGQNVMTSDICAYKFCHGCGAKMVEPQEREG